MCLGFLSHLMWFLLQKVFSIFCENSRHVRITSLNFNHDFNVLFTLNSLRRSPKNIDFFPFTALGIPRCHPKIGVEECIARSFAHLILRGNGKLLISHSSTSKFSLFRYFQNSINWAFLGLIRISCQTLRHSTHSIQNPRSILFCAIRTYQFTAWKIWKWFKWSTHNNFFSSKSALN